MRDEEGYGHAMFMLRIGLDACQSQHNRDDADQHVDEEGGAPSQKGDQQAAQRWTDSDEHQSHHSENGKDQRRRFRQSHAIGPSANQQHGSRIATGCARTNKHTRRQQHAEIRSETTQ